MSMAIKTKKKVSKNRLTKNRKVKQIGGNLDDADQLIMTNSLMNILNILYKNRNVKDEFGILYDEIVEAVKTKFLEDKDKSINFNLYFTGDEIIIGTPKETKPKPKPTVNSTSLNDQNQMTMAFDPATGKLITVKSGEPIPETI
jgi:hypothetical protein